MSNNRIRWEGLQELRAALRKLPEELTAEAVGIVLTAANEARAEIAAQYERKLKPPADTGKLLAGLDVTREDTSGRFGVSVRIRNRAKHASLFERGTQTRKTALGRNRGAMPPGRVFVPTVIRKRREMYARLKELLVRHGLIVTGDA